MEVNGIECVFIEIFARSVLSETKICVQSSCMSSLLVFSFLPFCRILGIRDCLSRVVKSRVQHISEVFLVKNGYHFSLVVHISLGLVALTCHKVQSCLTISAELVVFGEVLWSVLAELKEAGIVVFYVCISKVVKLISKCLLNIGLQFGAVL